MKYLILALLLAGCAQPETTKQGPGTDIDRLEARVALLQSTLDAFIQQKAQEKADILKHDACTNQCVKLFPYTEEGLNEDRSKCFEGCGPLPFGASQC